MSGSPLVPIGDIDAGGLAVVRRSLARDGYILVGDPGGPFSFCHPITFQRVQVPASWSVLAVLRAFAHIHAGVITATQSLNIRRPIAAIQSSC